MLRYIIVRLIWICIVLITFLSLLFVSIRIVPEFPPTNEDQKEIYYARQEKDGYYYSELITDPGEVQKIARGERNDDWYYREMSEGYRVYKPVPIIKQYTVWIKNVVTEFDWGLSTRVKVNEPVFDLMKEKLPHTIKLNMLALIIFIPVGFILGIIAALRKNKLTDNIISLGVMIFISIPAFVVMLLLVMFLGYQLNLLPPQYPSSDITGSIQLKALVLPVLALSFFPIATLTRLTRAELTEVLTSEFLLLARTKGLTRRQAVIRHAMRNSMVPLVPVIIFSFVRLVGGSIIIERIYSIPGMGRLYLDALTLNSFDYNLILALSGFYTSISLFAILIVDLSYGIVDPRIRMGARK